MPRPQVAKACRSITLTAPRADRRRRLVYHAHWCAALPPFYEARRMSVLPSGQPLHRALPDLEDLMADPESYLRAAPLAFGPRRMYGLAGLFALPGAAFLISCVV